MSGRPRGDVQLQRVLQVLFAAQLAGRHRLADLAREAKFDEAKLDAVLRDIALIDHPDTTDDALGYFLHDPDLGAESEFDLEPGEILAEHTHRFFRRAQRLTVPHAVILVAALAAVVDLGDAELTRGARSLIDKLRQAVVTTAGRDALTMLDALRPDDDEPDHDPELVTTLRTAAGRHRVRITTSDDGRVHELDPIRLVHDDGRTYLWAWDPGADRFVAVAVRSIRDVEVTAEPTVVPRRQPAFDRYAGVGEDVRFAVRLDASAAWVPRYYRCDTVTPVDDGVLEVTMRAPDVEWVVSFVRRLGTAVLDARLLGQQSGTTSVGTGTPQRSR